MLIYFLHVSLQSLSLICLVIYMTLNKSNNLVKWTNQPIESSLRRIIKRQNQPIQCKFLQGLSHKGTICDSSLRRIIKRQNQPIKCIFLQGMSHKEEPYAREPRRKGTSPCKNMQEVMNHRQMDMFIRCVRENVCNRSYGMDMAECFPKDWTWVLSIVWFSC